MWNTVFLPCKFWTAEYASQGSLYDFISKNQLDFKQILKWSREMALGNTDLLGH